MGNKPMLENVYKSNKGFTLIECIIAIAMLTIVCGAVFKAFGVSSKVNASVYEKDRATVFTVKKIEDVKKDPYTFFKNNKKDDETKYYSTDNRVYNVDEIQGFKADKIIGNPQLDNIKCVKNYAHLKEFYDWNWNAVSEGKEVYTSEIEVKRTTDILNVGVYEPLTTMDVKKQNGHVSKDRFMVVFMKKYFAILMPDDRLGENNYIFWVVHTYDYDKFIADMKSNFKGTPTPSQIDQFFNDRQHYESEYPVINPDKPTETATLRRYPVQGHINDSIPVRIDFDNGAYQTNYEVDVYNMADKPMDLSLLHSVSNDSQVNFNIKGGYVNLTEADINKKIDKTLYDIKVTVKKKETPLLEYETQKYVHDELGENW